MPKEEPEMTEANACSQCGFDLRLPPECTKERWDAMEAVIAAARNTVSDKAMSDGHGGVVSDTFWTEEEIALREAVRRLDGSE